jgi:prolyl oligopeptidase
VSYFDYYIFTLRDERWGFAADSLLVCYLDDLIDISRRLQAERAASSGPAADFGYLEGEAVMSDADAQRIFFPLFTPTASAKLCSTVALKDFLVLVAIDDVKSKLVLWELRSQTRRAGVPISQAFRPPPISTPWSDANFDVVAAFSRHADGSSNELIVESFGFLKPGTLELIDLSAVATPIPARLKATPDRFDPSGMSVQQHFATSADGTRVPFFVVGKALETPRQARPLLLFGYGAHGVVLKPGYNLFAIGTRL